jgi:hypothetical protein
MDHQANGRAGFAATLRVLLAPLERALRRDPTDTPDGRRSRAVADSEAMADTARLIVDAMIEHPSPMYAPDGGRTEPDRVARLARVLQAECGEQSVEVEGVASAALFALLDVAYERRGAGLWPGHVVALDAARAAGRRDAYMSMIRYVREYADSTTDPGSTAHLRLLDLVLALRTRYGGTDAPVAADAVPARVRYGGTLRCGTCGTPHLGTGYDGGRCPDCQPTLDLEGRAKQ